MSTFKRGDRIHVPADSPDIDSQFLNQSGTIITFLEGYGHTGDYYDVQFDNVEPPFGEKPYGPGNYWKVNAENMHLMVFVELTPEGIEAFLNA